MESIQLHNTSNNSIFNMFMHEIKELPNALIPVVGKLIQDLYLFSCRSNIKQINLKHVSKIEFKEKQII